MLPYLLACSFPFIFSRSFHLYSISTILTHAHTHTRIHAHIQEPVLPRCTSPAADPPCGHDAIRSPHRVTYCQCICAQLSQGESIHRPLHGAARLRCGISTCFVLSIFSHCYASLTFINSLASPPTPYVPLYTRACVHGRTCVLCVCMCTYVRACVCVHMHARVHVCVSMCV